MSGGTGDFGAVWDPAAIGNYDTSRLKVDLIIDHHTACPFSAAEGRFKTFGAQVSAHFIVDQDGTVYETVPLGSTAYHSGDYGVNERSVGIEHVSGPVGQDFFTDAQYQATAQLHVHIAEYFGFPLDTAHVWPHRQVTATACPGVLDIPRILSGGGPAVPTQTIVPYKPISGVVFDTPTNDRSFLDYNTVAYVPGQIAAIGQNNTWSEAKLVADPNGGAQKWLLKWDGSTWAVWADAFTSTPGGISTPTNPPDYLKDPTPPVVVPPADDDSALAARVTALEARLTLVEAWAKAIELK